MTEISYFWDIDSIGDGQATYSDDEFALALLLMFNYDRTKVVLTSTRARYADWRSSFNRLVRVSGGNFVISEYARALVDGRFWSTDADITLAPASGNGYYAVILRRDLSGGAGDQTVRAALLYNAVAAPTPTQNAATWECVLAQGQVVAGVAQIDSFEFVAAPRHLNITLRDGADRDDWSERESTDRPRGVWSIDHPLIQVGAINWTATAAEATIKVTFPERFRIGSSPLIFVTPVNYSGGTPSHSYVIRIVDTNERDFTIMVDDDTNIEGFNWLAVGPEENDHNYF